MAAFGPLLSGIAANRSNTAPDNDPRPATIS